MLEDEYRVARAVPTGSGTEALTLAMAGAAHLLDRPPTIALPAFSCYDVAAAAAYQKRPLVFYDLDVLTLGPDAESLNSCLELGADVLVIASLFGIPPNWDVVDRVTSGRPAIVIEDAAQGHGASWKGRRLGGQARLGVLSFGRGKGWTGGTGGALLVRDEADAVRMSGLLSLRSRSSRVGVLARAAAHWALGHPRVYGLPRSVPGVGLGQTRYRDARQPTGMAEEAAALVLHSRVAADAEAQIRRRVAREYEHALAGYEHVHRFAVPECGQGGYIRYPVMIDGGLRGISRGALATRLGAAGSYPKPLPLLSAVTNLAVGPSRSESQGEWPVASTLAANLLTLPTHGLTSHDERRELVRLLS